MAGLLLLAAAVAVAQLGGVAGDVAPRPTVWTASTTTCGTAETSGQADDTGVTWATCGTGLVRIAADGARTQQTITTFTSPRRVAPSPDGSRLYIVTNGAKEGVANYAIIRLKPGAAANTWVRDATFATSTFPYAGKEYVACGSYLATDALGDIYATTVRGCAAAGAPGTVVKYAPTGQLLATFGVDETRPREPGAFKTTQGITASRDGTRVVVADQGNNRLHEFRYVRSSRSYVWHRTLETESVTLDCDNPPATGARWKVAYADGTSVTSASDRIAGERRYLCSPYDARFDAWGRLFVADTTHRRILMFDEELLPLATVADRYTATTARPHTLTVTGTGGVLVPIWNQAYTPSTGTDPGFAGPRSAVTPLPLPDATAPTLTSVAGPAESEDRTVTLTITASDDAAGTGLTKLRLANEDGTWAGWKAFSRTAAWTLPETFGPKVVYAQVVDGAGNESAVVRTSIRHLPDTIAPTIAAVATPATTQVRDITVAIDATDGGRSGLAEMRLANDGGLWEPWRAFAPNVAWQLSVGVGAKVVAVQLRDGAGNVSAVTRVSVSVVASPAEPSPTAPPTPPTTQPAPTAPAPTGGGPTTAAPSARPAVRRATLARVRATRTVIVRTSVATPSTVRMLRLRNERGAWSRWRRYTPSQRWTLTAGRGTKLVRVQVRDARGRVSAIRTLRLRVR
ncbi:MAG: chromosome condensation regulator [Thermoleophilia bacterium]|nr:chromosome condensation regulator [Thermoleophilia bacterium]